MKTSKQKNEYVLNSPLCSFCGKADCKCLTQNILCPKCASTVEDCKCGWVVQPEDPPLPETTLDFNKPEEKGCCGYDGLEDDFAMADEPQTPKPNYLGAAVPFSQTADKDDTLEHIELEF